MGEVGGEGGRPASAGPRRPEPGGPAAERGGAQQPAPGLRPLRPLAWGRKSWAELSGAARARAAGNASGRERREEGAVRWEGTEQAPAAAAPPPPGQAAARGAGGGGSAGRAAGGGEECSREARAAGRLGGGRGGGASARGSAETWSPSSRAGGAPALGTSQRWNPRNAGRQELLVQAREKSRTFGAVALGNVQR